MSSDNIIIDAKYSDGYLKSTGFHTFMNAKTFRHVSSMRGHVGLHVVMLDQT